MGTRRLSIKERLHEVIFGTETQAGKNFDVVLMLCIMCSLLVTIFQSLITHANWLNLFLVIEYLLGTFFTLEYILRIYCSPRPKSYIFSFFGVVDLLSILPLYLGFFFTGAHYMMVLRSFRLVRVFRVFKLFNFMKEGNILLQSLQKSFQKILVFFIFVFILNICLGTTMFVVESAAENSQFTNVPNGIYWSIVTMTTVGYGDITPVTALGKSLSAFIMLLGYTIIAVPTGIVTATMVNSSRRRAKKLRCPNCHAMGHEGDAEFCRFCGTGLVMGL